ncbi:hypothetical protein BJI49_07395 [Acetobacter pasteurianus]|nr:hypothetical protein BJI49_07395 [Acetobacter pasteurianus]
MCAPPVLQNAPFCYNKRRSSSGCQKGQHSMTEIRASKADVHTLPYCEFPCIFLPVYQGRGMNKSFQSCKVYIQLGNGAVCQCAGCGTLAKTAE